MTDRRIHPLVYVLLLTALCCRGPEKETTSALQKGTYGYDAAFLERNHRKIIELTDDNGSAKVLITAEDQGRVMTSTTDGDNGASYGWINYDLLASGKRKQQFNPVGGEERFWLGPEGGQYSLYFHSKDSFDIQHWQVPPVIDTVTFTLASQTQKEAVFTRDASLTNYSGTTFDLRIQRTIRLLDRIETSDKLKLPLSDSIRFVGYETINSVENTGKNSWTKESGLLSIWLLGMMIPSGQTQVIIPFHPGPKAKSLINSSYFGPVPDDRLHVLDSVLYFRCDGKHRSKLGLSPRIAKPIAASFDAQKNVLTVILFSIDRDNAYVNSQWKIQEDPYSGDVVNAYNDGPLADGTQLGPFYELESSSPALALKPGERGTYTQSTYHFTGDLHSLNALAKGILGVSLSQVQ